MKRLIQLLAVAALFSVTGCVAHYGPNETYERGKKQAESGDKNGAIETLSAGALEDPGHMPMRFDLSRLQYEVGESFHLKEREALRKAAQFEQQPDGRDEAAQLYRKANDLRAKATPYYQAARENLEFVVDHEEKDHEAAWAWQVLCRVRVFFGEWREAADALQKAIELGKPNGYQLAQWREFLSGLREKAKKRATP